jgi:hypothetical protein
MTIPRTFVIYRAVITAFTVLLILLFALGLGGLGPFDGLHTFATSAVGWLKDQMGVTAA